MLQVCLKNVCKLKPNDTAPYAKQIWVFGYSDVKKKKLSPALMLGVNFQGFKNLNADDLQNVGGA